MKKIQEVLSKLDHLDGINFAVEKTESSKPNVRFAQTTTAVRIMGPNFDLLLWGYAELDVLEGDYTEQLAWRDMGEVVSVSQVVKRIRTLYSKRLVKLSNAQTGLYFSRKLGGFLQPDIRFATLLDSVEAAWVKAHFDGQIAEVV